VRASSADDDQFRVPTLEELLGGEFESKLEIGEKFPFPGGESAALDRLDRHINEKVREGAAAVNLKAS
jgi:hypothetical protein